MLWGSQGNQAMTYSNEWFHGRDAIQEPPQEAVYDCSGPGPADEAVVYWVERLSFDGPAWLIREHLKGHGAWDAAQLCDHQQNLQRLFWVWCGDLREDPDYYLYLEG